jgi:hypothetical protein
MSPSPEIYPHSYDPAVDMVYLVRMSEPEFRNASFLDQRVLLDGKAGDWATWPDFWRQAGAGASAKGCDFIFHIGHVGSTLVSRLLGEHGAILSLREPTPLRTLAALEIETDAPYSPISPQIFDARLEQLVALWSRTWRAEQKALVKGTSITCALAPRLLSRDPAARAIVMFTQAEPYLASILGAHNSIHDLRDQAPLRLRRLHRSIGATPFRLWNLSPGEMIAMSWAAEMIALAEASAGREDRVLRVDFERFLASPQAHLSTAFAFLGAAASPADIDALARGPIMHRYSKAPEHAYDAKLRRDVLDYGRQTHPHEIRAGLQWLEDAARSHSLIGQALDFAASAG